MTDLRYTLLADGPSDRALIPILTWLLREHGVTGAIQPAPADLGRLQRPPKALPDRIHLSVELYPCDLLFIHRDAESVRHEERCQEIRQACEAVRGHFALPPVVAVVPVRMQEVWLLFDEMALRQAAGNPQGRQLLTLPALAQLEAEPDPKARLFELLREASGLPGRRRHKFRAHTAATRVTSFIEDFSPLRALPAFRMLEVEVARVIFENSWHVHLE